MSDQWATAAFFVGLFLGGVWLTALLNRLEADKQATARRVGMGRADGPKGTPWPSKKLWRAASRRKAR